MSTNVINRGICFSAEYYRQEPNLMSMLSQHGQEFTEVQPFIPLNDTCIVWRRTQKYVKGEGIIDAVWVVVNAVSKSSPVWDVLFQAYIG